MELLGIFSAFGLAASAGLNAYIPLLTVALLARFTDLIVLAKPWDALESWWIIGLLSVLVIVEFVSDKVPVVNHVNDAIMTFIRPAAGAIAFAASTSVVKGISPVFALAMGLLVAGSINTVKSVIVRPAVSVATATAGNVPVSMAEDAVATVTSVLAIVVPVFIACAMVLVTAWIIWFFWRRSNQESETVTEEEKRY
ncbi:MAG: DUF4126 domain-containing protein [Anaerolineaceae bacterium]|nr:DUF4126 domain-containing protein [Anaerolineaceae bacterium]